MNLMFKHTNDYCQVQRPDSGITCKNDRCQVSAPDSGILRYILILSFLVSILISFPANALTSKVTLIHGGTPVLRNRIANNLTIIVNSLESKNWQQIKSCCTDNGLIDLKDLVEKTDCINVDPLTETNLHNLPGGGYEVRNVKVMVDMRGTRGNPNQYLVFTLNGEGLVTDVRFAVKQAQDIIKRGEHLQDFAFRQQILQFIEIFRTAYNRKDIDHLRKVFSDDALIIIGKVLKEKGPDILEKSTLSRERIELIRMDKKTYLTNLSAAFAKNEFIKVNFKDIKIIRHPQPEKEKIYGVTLEQGWHSSTYSDHGYLFLMIDFTNEDCPQIQVRAWQPQKFPDGSVVGLGNFEVID